MHDFYPPGPNQVPSDLTQPSPSYRRHAWIAGATLAAFAALYLSLTIWFGWTTVRLAARVMREFSFYPFIVALLSAFITVFLVKSLFAVRRTSGAEDMEVTAAQQPALFAFLNRLADDAGAARPYRVFLSSEVNAAVFYDLSLANVLVPSKKNLVIGLGLVNVLTLGELKAVLAHEFGHFAQRSMAVGRWVYTTQQIASHLIHARGALDGFLLGLSRIDVRVAWVAWVLRLAIWSIRALLDTGFAAVVLAQRALSREMELQADLVAVALTGSDALIHALHRLRAADEAWDTTLGFAGEQAHEARAVPDLFALQSRVVEHLRNVLDDATFGAPVPVPVHGAEHHRVFKNEVAHPPKMWLTHPPGREREDNAKRRYIAAPIDERSAWVLFDGADGLRRDVTARLLAKAVADKQAVAISLEDSIAKLDLDFARPWFDRRYRGAYLGRSIVRDVNTPGDLVPSSHAHVDDSTLAALYTDTLAADVKRWRALEEESVTLDALHEGALQPADGILRYRGRVIAQRELPTAIAEVKAERTAVRARLSDHDRRCRQAHLALARNFGDDWQAYLRSLLALLHYAEHTEANLIDARDHLNNVLHVVLADGEVSASEATRIVAAATEVHVALWELFEQRTHVVLPEPIAQAMKVTSWGAALPIKMNLAAPEQSNLGTWLNEVGPLLGDTLGPIGDLRRETLAQLLSTEDALTRATREQSAMGTAPSSAKTPGRYTVVPTGTQRARQKRLHWWDRFQLADGPLATGARVLVAGGIMLAALGASQRATETTVSIVNGLATNVHVVIGDVGVDVPANDHASVSLDLDAPVRVETKTAQGELIETFEAPAQQDAAPFYNVARAQPLVQWTAFYEQGKQSVDVPLGNPRWGETHARHVFEEPPRQSKDRSRVVLSAVPLANVDYVLSTLPSDQDRQALIAAHARWDAEHTPTIAAWLGLARGLPDFAAIATQRLTRNPKDMLTLRAQQDVFKGAERASLCQQHASNAKANPSDLDATYLSLRCIADDAARDEAFIAEHAKHPQHGWLAWAAGVVFAERAQWPEAATALQIGWRAVVPLQAQNAVTVARVLRVNAPGSNLEELSAQSDDLRWLLDLESDAVLEPPTLVAYRKLHAGDLQGALDAASPSPELRDHMVRLVAASFGATQAQLDASFAMPVERGIGNATVWSSLAIFALHGKDVSALSDSARKLHPQADALLQLLDCSWCAEDSARFTKALSGLPVELRGYALLMATIALQDDAPAAWRAQARQLLFMPERPYTAP